MTASELFLFPESGRRLPEVEEWLWGEPENLYALARAWFEYLRDRGDDVSELLHDGCPVACAGNAAFAYVNVFRHHVNLGFFTGAFLDDPHKLLQGTGKRMRHIKIRPDEPVDSGAVRALAEQAYRDVKARLQQAP